jgi:23S rRNA pseudouridine2605 synthase
LTERLQKYMARCGVASRRSCEKIIKQGRVSVNGQTVHEMGVKINPAIDIVRVDGKVISPEKEYIYILLNKPTGYITSVSDPLGRPTVLDLIGDVHSRIYPVGRLDYDSEGLLLLTNDGDLAYYLTHPKYEIKKEYYVKVIGNPREKDIETLRKGVNIGGYTTWPAQVERIKSSDNNSVFRIIIHEGKNRQVRRMFEAIGHPVVHLRREKLANLALGSLKVGDWRFLTQKEVEELKAIVLSKD